MRLPKSLAVRVGAVCAAAAIAVGGGVAAAGSALAAPAHVKVPTSLSIANTTPVAHKHKTTAVVYGQLTGPDGSTIAGMPIFLQRQGPKGNWFVAQIGRTHANGWVRFRVHVRKVAASFRLVFRGKRNFAKAVSAAVTITPATITPATSS
jgi:hypothetical protein